MAQSGLTTEDDVARSLASWVGPSGVPANEYLRVVPSWLRQTVAEQCRSLTSFVSRHPHVLRLEGDPSAPRLCAVTNPTYVPTGVNIASASDEEVARMLAEWIGAGVLASDYLSVVPKHCRGIVAGRCGALASFVPRYPHILALRGTGAGVRLVPANSSSTAGEEIAVFGSDEAVAAHLAGWVGNGVRADDYVLSVPPALRSQIVRRVGNVIAFAKRFPAHLTLVEDRLCSVDALSQPVQPVGVDISAMPDEDLARKLAEWIGVDGVHGSNYLTTVPRHLRSQVAARVGALSRFVARYPRVLTLYEDRVRAVQQQDHEHLAVDLDAVRRFQAAAGIPSVLDDVYGIGVPASAAPFSNWSPASDRPVSASTVSDRFGAWSPGVSSERPVPAMSAIARPTSLSSLPSSTFDNFPPLAASAPAPAPAPVPTSIAVAVAPATVSHTGALVIGRPGATASPASEYGMFSAPSAPGPSVTASPFAAAGMYAPAPSPSEVPSPPAQVHADPGAVTFLVPPPPPPPPPSYSAAMSSGTNSPASSGLSAPAQPSSSVLADACDNVRDDVSFVVSQLNVPAHALQWSGAKCHGCSSCTEVIAGNVSLAGWVRIPVDPSAVLLPRGECSIEGWSAVFIPCTNGATDPACLLKHGPRPRGSRVPAFSGRQVPVALRQVPAHEIWTTRDLACAAIFAEAIRLPRQRKCWCVLEAMQHPSTQHKLAESPLPCLADVLPDKFACFSSGDYDYAVPSALWIFMEDGTDPFPDLVDALALDLELVAWLQKHQLSRWQQPLVQARILTLGMLPNMTQEDLAMERFSRVPLRDKFYDCIKRDFGLPAAAGASAEGSAAAGAAHTPSN